MKYLASIIFIFGLTLGVVGPNVGAQGNRNSSPHAIAVKRCRDNYDAAKRAAKNITDPTAQQKALATAKSEYDNCIKEASKVH